MEVCYSNESIVVADVVGDGGGGDVRLRSYHLQHLRVVYLSVKEDVHCSRMDGDRLAHSPSN